MYKVDKMEAAKAAAANGGVRNNQRVQTKSVIMKDAPNIGSASGAANLAN